MIWGRNIPRGGHCLNTQPLNYYVILKDCERLKKSWAIARKFVAFILLLYLLLCKKKKTFYLSMPVKLPHVYRNFYNWDIYFSSLIIRNLLEHFTLNEK